MKIQKPSRQIINNSISYENINGAYWKKSFKHFEATGIKKNWIFYADKNKTANILFDKIGIG